MSVLVGGGGGGAVMAFVGRAVGVGAGGLGFLPRGIAASSLSDPDSKENLRFFEGGWGGLGCGLGWGGGEGLARWW